jgi:hypothetical protein
MKNRKVPKKILGLLSKTPKLFLKVLKYGLYGIAGIILVVALWLAYLEINPLGVKIVDKDDKYIILKVNLPSLSLIIKDLSSRDKESSKKKKPGKFYKKKFREVDEKAFRLLSEHCGKNKEAYRFYGKTRPSSIYHLKTFNKKITDLKFNLSSAKFRFFCAKDLDEALFLFYKKIPNNWNTHIDLVNLYPNLKYFKVTGPANIINKTVFSKIPYSKVEEYVKHGKPSQKKELAKKDKLYPFSSGTGFVVSKKGHVITNYHVVERCNGVVILFENSEVEADVVAVDKMNDLAILRAEIKPNYIFSISDEDVSLMQDVIIAGYPLGKKISSAIKTHKGSVTGLAGFGDNYSNFQTDATINQGNSGGPVIDKNGNVVGVAVASWLEEGVQSIHFGIKSSTLRTFGKANGIKFLSPNTKELSNKKLGKLITEATFLVECWMDAEKIKRIIEEEGSKKAIYSEHK